MFFCVRYPGRIENQRDFGMKMEIDQLDYLTPNLQYSFHTCTVQYMSPASYNTLKRSHEIFFFSKTCLRILLDLAYCATYFSIANLVICSLDDDVKSEKICTEYFLWLFCSVLILSCKQSCTNFSES